MRILALESSGKVASASLLKDNVLLSEFYIDCGLFHSKTLASIVQSLLDVTDFKLKDVDFLAVANGPGSFTGLRIGVSIIKGMSLILNKPVIGVSTLHAMAQNAIMLDNNLICTAIDAKNGRFYSALFTVQDGKLIRILEDSAINVVDLFSKLLNYDNKSIVILGDGAEQLYDYINKNDVSKRLNVKIMNAEYRYQSSRGVAYAARDLILSKGNIITTSADKLQINYLVFCQAERELGKKLGLKRS